MERFAGRRFERRRRSAIPTRLVLVARHRSAALSGWRNWFLGCVAAFVDSGGAPGAAVRVLPAANGIEVVIPGPTRIAAGAMTHHQGDLEQTQGLGQRSDRLFRGRLVRPGPTAADPNPSMPCWSTASGCGHTLKKYDASWLAGNPAGRPAPEAFHRIGWRCAGNSSHRGRTERTTSAAQLPSRSGPQRRHSGDGGSGPCAWAYHDACHIDPRPGLRDQPRRLLRQIPMCSFLESGGKLGVCWRSAGIYTCATQRSRRAGGSKAADLSNTGAELA